MAPAKDRTAQQHESLPHDEPHGHPVPVPHLKAEWPDDHGPDFSHHHVHIRGGGNHYDHHDPGEDDDHGRPAADAPDDNSGLKLDGQRADNNSP